MHRGGERVRRGEGGQGEGRGGVRLSVFWFGSLNPHSILISFGCLNRSSAQAQPLARLPVSAGGQAGFLAAL